MTALLAAETGAGDLHPLEDVLVADRRADDLPAGRLDGRAGARRWTARTRPAPPPGSSPARRADRGPGCPGPGRRRRSGPAASTAIRRSASPSSANPTSAPAASTVRGQRRRRRRAALDVDVDAVRLGVDHLDLGPSPPGSRADRASPNRSRNRARPGARRPRSSPASPSRCSTVRVEQRRAVDRPAHLGVRDAAELLGPPDQPLELVLDRVVELEPGVVEHLEPVVVGRVVRRRDHDPGRERAPSREIGERRRRARRRRRGRRRRGWSRRRRSPRRTCRPTGACPGRRRSRRRDRRGGAPPPARGRRPSSA